ncbi:hypothetical protein ACFL3C_05440 [Patescibacteria group bacterium]
MTKRFEELDSEPESTNRPIDPNEIGSHEDDAAFAALFEKRAKRAQDASQIEVAQEVSHPERLKFRSLAEAKQVVRQRLQASEGDPRLTAQLLMELCNEYDGLIWDVERDETSSIFSDKPVWETVAVDGKYYVVQMFEVRDIHIQTYSVSKPKSPAKYYRIVKCGLPGVEETAERIQALYLPRITEILKEIGFKKPWNYKSEYHFRRKKWRKENDYVTLDLSSKYASEMMRLSISPSDNEELRNEILEAFREAGLDIHPSTLVQLQGCFKIIPNLSNIVIL